MMKGLMVDESMSSTFTSTSSGEVSASSSATRFESTNQPKKKRNLPGNPDPEAEVIALSPKTLMATNRFICEICNKGFQRDQNLQLHRRGHNLPWKLKQRSKEDEPAVVRKKVYVCPETTCVHHDPSRALGDLTGVKKHFSRKHGEKKWKCDKCSKRYAVQSDWKAHSKICGTREYRCDCGTLFSRRDSFITHRAFCDALAEESARAITLRAPIPNPLVLLSSSSSSSLQQTSTGGSSSVSHMQSQLVLHDLSDKHDDHDQYLFNGRDHSTNIPPWLAHLPPPAAAGDHVGGARRPSSSGAALMLLDHHQLGQGQGQAHEENPIGSCNPFPTSIFQAASVLPQMSATALLQKAADQMGSKPLQSPNASQIPHHQHYHHDHKGTSSGSSVFSAREEEVGMSGLIPQQQGNLASNFGINKAAAAGITSAGNFIEQAVGATSSTSILHHDMMMMNSLPASTTTGFEGSSSFNGLGLWNTDQSQLISRSTASGNNIAGNDGLTRDFLGLKAFPANLAAARLNRHLNSSSAHNHGKLN